MRYLGWVQVGRHLRTPYRSDESPCLGEPHIPAEDLPRRYEYQDTTEKHSYFDELANKGVANGTITRGRVLELAGASLLGAALGIFGLADLAQDRSRRRHSSCIPCDLSNPDTTIPAGTCCLAFTGSTQGCLATQQTCDAFTSDPTGPPWGAARAFARPFRT